MSIILRHRKLPLVIEFKDPKESWEKNIKDLLIEEIKSEGFDNFRVIGEKKAKLFLELESPTKTKKTKKPWFLYVLRCSDDTFYTGVSSNLDRRVNDHNHSSNGAKYTKTRRPVQLIYWRDFKDRSAAQKAEYKFKKLTRGQKEKIINEHL